MGWFSASFAWKIIENAKNKDVGLAKWAKNKYGCSFLRAQIFQFSSGLGRIVVCVLSYDQHINTSFGSAAVLYANSIIFIHVSDKTYDLQKAGYRKNITCKFIDLVVSLRCVCTLKEFVFLLLVLMTVRPCACKTMHTSFLCKFLWIFEVCVLVSKTTLGKENCSCDIRSLVVNYFFLDN